MCFFLVFFTIAFCNLINPLLVLKEPCFIIRGGVVVGPEPHQLIFTHTTVQTLLPPSHNVNVIVRAVMMADENGNGLSLFVKPRHDLYICRPVKLSELISPVALLFA